MDIKLVGVNSVQKGHYVVIDGAACKVTDLQVSRPGKHGHAKCRIEAIGVIDGKKRVLAIPGHERLDVPAMEKRKADSQPLKATENTTIANDKKNPNLCDRPTTICTFPLGKWGLLFAIIRSSVS